MTHDGSKPAQSSPACCRGTLWQSRYGTHKRGLNSKIHLAVDAHGMPVRVFITEGPIADGSQAYKLIDGIDAEYLLADNGYDSDALVESPNRPG